MEYPTHTRFFDDDAGRATKISLKRLGDLYILSITDHAGWTHRTLLDVNSFRKLRTTLNTYPEF
jgi:hypothetical protein